MSEQPVSPDRVRRQVMSNQEADRVAAELEQLREWAKSALQLDGWTEMLSHEQMHRHHKDEPYIGCVFCRDSFVPLERAERAEARLRECETALRESCGSYNSLVANLNGLSMTLGNLSASADDWDGPICARRYFETGRVSLGESAATPRPVAEGEGLSSSPRVAGVTRRGVEG